jgi:hypothetical protein
VDDEAAVCGDLIAVRVREFLSDAVRAEEARLATERLQTGGELQLWLVEWRRRVATADRPKGPSMVARTFLQRRGSAVHAGQNGTVAIERLLGDTSARRCKSAIRRAVVATSLDFVVTDFMPEDTELPSAFVVSGRSTAPTALLHNAKAANGINRSAVDASPLLALGTLELRLLDQIVGDRA